MTPNFSTLAYKAYTNGKFAALESILEAWENDYTRRGSGRLSPLAFHMGHIYKGLVALDQDNVALAKLELSKASCVRRNVVLSLCGPNLLLADRLLKRGEKKIVLKYLKNCRHIWSLPSRLYFARTWRAAIRRGETPDFGEHLYFYMSEEENTYPGAQLA